MMIKNKIELLAPAGNKEAFVGAINAGANAVYLSGKSFGARKYANNFTKEEIAELIIYAHLRNVKVYVTVNTLIFEEEINDLYEYCDFLVTNHVDALIVQDLGIIQDFCHRYPETEIHASTQMNTYNEFQLNFLANLGVKRVILARETSLNDIEKTLKNSNVDVEVFVHGALCVSYSGNCLFSSLRGGRSGNRGECAQPCRLKYSLYRGDSLVENDSYLLSTKDLMTIQDIDEVVLSGVKSLKIEGRMRKAEYVIATVRAYRKALDHFYENKPFDLDSSVTELLSVFNREYTKGYLLDEVPSKINNSTRPNHQGIEVGKVIGYHRGKTDIELTGVLRVGDGIRIIGDSDYGGQVGRIILKGSQVSVAKDKDVVTIDMKDKVDIGARVLKTSDSELESSLKSYLDESYGLIPLKIKLYSYVGKKLKIEIKKETTDLIIIESDYIVTPAKKVFQDEEKLGGQFAKFGNTCYYLETLEVLTDGLGFVPNGIINDLRREGIKVLEEVQLKREPKSIVKTARPLSKVINVPHEPKLVVKVENEKQYQKAWECGIKNIISTTKHSWVNNSEVKNYHMMNRIWYQLPENTIHDSFVVRDFGALSLAKESDVVADTTFNVTNSLTLKTLFEANVDRVCLSIESGLENTRNLIDGFNQKYNCMPNLEMIAYGRPDLMISKYCPVMKSEGIFRRDCKLCEIDDYALVNDRKDRFPLIREESCNLRVLHSKTINLIEYVPDITSLGINTIRLDFTIETPEEVEMVITGFQNRLNGKDYKLPSNHYTYGRFLK